MKRWGAVGRFGLAAMVLVLAACDGEGGAAPDGGKAADVLDVTDVDQGPDVKDEAAVPDVAPDRSRPLDTGCTTDEDGDGVVAVSCGGSDCDDGDPRRYPGNAEVCDAMGHDEDCNPCTVASATTRDGDGDMDTFVGVGCFNPYIGATPMCDPMAAQINGATLRVTGRDCDDTNNNVRPNQTESCNGRDDNCNGMVDEDVATASWYLDRDGDGHAGSGETATIACAAPSSRHVQVNDDCDDTDPLVSPGAPEVCDGAMRDENCNGMSNEGCGCAPVGTSRRCCGDRGTQSCTATTMGSMWGECSSPATPEVCNGVDDDCDGVIDEETQVSCYRDSDGDGFATATAMLEMRCPPMGRPGMCPSNYTATAPRLASGTMAATVDCDDTPGSGAMRFPGGRESCNTLDDNCDGAIDEGDPGGGGTCATGRSGICGPGANHCLMGRVVCVGNVMGRAEVCNGLDDNCDGANDEGDPGGGTACSVPGLYGPCAAGITHCSGGMLRCSQTVFPQSANCNSGGDLNCNNRPDNAEWTPCTSAQDPLHPTFNGCEGRQCAGAGACVVDRADTPYRHDWDGDGACVPTDDSFCTGYPLGPEWRRTSTCRGGGDDCDDRNGARFPGNGEIPDGIDNNCSGSCDEGFVSRVYALVNPGNRADNMLSTVSGEAGWSTRHTFFTYNSPISSRTVPNPLIRCVASSGRHFITQGVNNCRSPNRIEGYYGYLLASTHTGTSLVQDCYGTCSGSWCEMASTYSCAVWASVDGLPWMTWPGGFGYTVGSDSSACWAP